MLDMAILGLLEERDLYGYEIRRQLRDHLGLLANVSFGSIYPALTRLEKSGAVVATDGGSASDPRTTAAAPPTGSLSGELAVLRARRSPGTRSRRGKKVYRITDAGRQLFTELLADGGATDSGARPDLDPYARSVVEHTTGGVTRDINWLDSLIASERAALADAHAE